MTTKEWSTQAEKLAVQFDWEAEQLTTDSVRARRNGDLDLAEQFEGDASIAMACAHEIRQGLSR